ncbi:hypothetical protein [uncultured Bdellovibrio sp.]|uniref:hypothetical protein n=1 Tax=Bdellovibrio sp. HCB-162 TaxID=3394234 RepID=UPI0025E31518|nr:hypothetical protein [uncultured Bdellovibrio sp.]
MSGHHKNKGFSQTSKKYDGEIKAQHQQSRNKQMDHPSPKREETDSAVELEKFRGAGKK